MVINSGDHELPTLLEAVLSLKDLKFKIFISTPKHNGIFRFKTLSSSNEQKCTHCGNIKHTFENCFQLYEYLD